MLLFCHLILQSAIAQSENSWVHLWPMPSLGMERLPFEEHLIELRDHEEIQKIRDSFTESQFRKAELDSVTGTLSGEDRWQLKCLYFEAQKGWTDKSQIYNSEMLFVPKEAFPVFSKNEIATAFSQDSLLNFNPTILPSFYDLNFHLDTWSIAQVGNVLVIFMYRSAPFDRKMKEEVLLLNDETLQFHHSSRETHTESYWYYFEEVD